VFILTKPQFGDIIVKRCLKAHVPVAQLDRVFGYEPKGRGFESLQARQQKPLKTLSFQGFLFFPLRRISRKTPQNIIDFLKDAGQDASQIFCGRYSEIPDSHGGGRLQCMFDGNYSRSAVGV
jgi:hypothetical protein